MVGKPNLPEAGDDRPELQGAAHPTPGLAALDQEREASMADEGGASGATVEGELPSVLSQLQPAEPPADLGERHTPPYLRAIAAGAAIGFVVGVVRYVRRP